MVSLVKFVGKRIREIRKEMNMTQEELAEKCGIQTSYLAGVERGDRNITLQTLEKITDGLEISPAKLFKLDLTNERLGKIEEEDLIEVLVEMLKDKTPLEVHLILNISKEIFTTYKEH